MDLEDGVMTFRLQKLLRANFRCGRMCTSLF